MNMLNEVLTLFSELGGTILGLFPQSMNQPESSSSTNDFMNLMMQIRNEVRKQKLWGISDFIRDGLKTIGFLVEDKKDGTSWRRMNKQE